METPKRGLDGSDEERDLAVGEAKERGGATFENVSMRTLRFPRESIEGGESGNATGRAGKNVGEETDGIGKSFGAAVGVGDEESGAAEFVGEIGGEERFGNIVKAGQRNVLSAVAESTHGIFESGVAKKSVQTFANGRKDHAEGQTFAGETGEPSRIF